MSSSSPLVPVHDYIVNECKDLEDGRARVLQALNAVPHEDQELMRMKTDVQHRVYSLSTLKFLVTNHVQVHKKHK